MNRTHIPLAMIAALGENQVIGVDNQLPWHLPEDLQHFKRMTLGKPVIMGRKTWDSIGRPLPGRLNIVISRQADLHLSGAEVFTDLPAALRRARDWAQLEQAEEIMLIGGAQLYRQALPLAERLYLTRVALAPEGDAFFPALDARWRCTSAVEHPARETKPAFAFEVWQLA
ncbi:dihydrofolate reductase [Atopomonas sediminilitoris]|uniref:dihydrofolate reductase n=1 Tax=Atopomonas sediminilitoris TaxID=2919919 RepID=UPI001F4E0DB0|nr:dihydrofolate reductase [Atopomonas sediminilitoris]MCJ8169611.1 dihydrofolate reductase [Atopomonas sediminilitoris]